MKTVDTSAVAGSWLPAVALSKTWGWLCQVLGAKQISLLQEAFKAGSGIHEHVAHVLGISTTQLIIWRNISVFYMHAAKWQQEYVGSITCIRKKLIYIGEDIPKNCWLC